MSSLCSSVSILPLALSHICLAQVWRCCCFADTFSWVLSVSSMALFCTTTQSESVHFYFFLHFKNVSPEYLRWQRFSGNNSFQRCELLCSGRHEIAGTRFDSHVLSNFQGFLPSCESTSKIRRGHCDVI